MIKSEIDVWVRPRPDYQERGLFRNTSALAAELMGCGKKRERERIDRVCMSFALSLPSGLFSTFLFRLVSLGLPIIPEDDARDGEIKSFLYTYSFLLHYRARWEAAIRIPTLSLIRLQLRDNPTSLDALCRYGREAQ